MTEDGRRQAALDELRLANEELAVAEQLIASRHYRIAVSRAYFAAFHAARARLYVAGFEPKTHGGVQTLWNSQLVRSGLYEPATSRTLAGLQRYRELADYAGDFIVDEESARAELAAAAGLVRRIVEDVG